MKYNVPVRVKGTKKIGEIVGKKEYLNYTIYHVMFNHSYFDLEYFTRDKLVYVKDQSIIDDYNVKIDKRNEEVIKSIMISKYNALGCDYATAALPMSYNTISSIQWIND